ncbi:GGDEF domain-containing protein GdpS [Staphylococcus massiliensis]|uniref:GGDEF domain-containing protein n=1 Tax=Staphylococcus massiliensis S46 TaxID=1229783 RepID=K9B417_9STAP|nr:GGDEF domain-containing protein [Staphylococcus massiliensis]EKU48520.1 hypothetical protein C273_04895 [Staphylococcus massiliensis S46]MCG3400073.1 GGDEF domain-containing protein [Staphylococcus massiliensis]MCG3401796.1 GGDEF domain-containing protein [Staphylococcus massiliensis]MCG3412668.1 GGDEF domain-containing protein [Staphylococcus massiliensis]POA01529.1 GGDEF domain-containing protein [Staphylococcus massiliensis CCUG 55927]
MIQAIIYNISVTVAGIYLFHRLEYSESSHIRFSKSYTTLLLTVVALLLASYPIDIPPYVIHLTFVPLLFLGRYTNFFYTMLSAIIIVLADTLIFDNTIAHGITILIIALISSIIGPFLKQGHIASLQILNGLSIVIFAGLILFNSQYDWIELLYLIPLSFVLTIISSIIFVDIWRFFSLIQRYENEDSVDYLTGLGNVKSFDRHLNKCTQVAAEKDESLGLLLIDIDGFKDVNDAYTHYAGDAVLKQMSQLLINYVPKQFKIFRNGGEEFSVVVQNISLDESVKLAESIRRAVEKSSFHLPSKEVIKLSVSIGVGHLTKDNYKSQRKVFKDADDMLHVAKNEGRNKVMFNPIVKI